MRLIQWVFLAEWSLSLKELLHAFAVEPEDRNIDSEHFENGKALLDSCLGLVIIHEGTSTLRLVHKALQEYLQTQFKGGSLFAMGYSDIAKTCLTYMSFEFPEHTVLCDALITRFTFLHYAITQWGNHLRESGMTDAEVQTSITVLQKKRKSDSLFWSLLYWPLANRFLSDSSQAKSSIDNAVRHASTFSALHIAAYFGVDRFLNCLLKASDIDINKRDCLERTPLS